MTVLAEYPDALWAQVVSYKYYIIEAVLVTDNFTKIRVHSPGTSMSGSFAAGVKILVQPYTNYNSKRKCGYYVLAIETKSSIMGANPSLSNFLFKRYLQRADTYFCCVNYKTEITCANCRFDFQLLLPNQLKPYVEVKSCFFTHENKCVFPLKHLRDLPKLDKTPPKYTPMSPRAIKHLRQLVDCSGILIFLAHCTHFQKFEINPRQKELKNLYEQLVNKYLLKVQWTRDKKVIFNSFLKL